MIDIFPGIQGLHRMLQCDYRTPYRVHVMLRRLLICGKSIWIFICLGDTAFLPIHRRPTGFRQVCGGFKHNDIYRQDVPIFILTMLRYRHDLVSSSPSDPAPCSC